MKKIIRKIEKESASQGFPLSEYNWYELLMNKQVEIERACTEAAIEACTNEQRNGVSVAVVLFKNGNIKHFIEIGDTTFYAVKEGDAIYIAHFLEWSQSDHNIRRMVVRHLVQKVLNTIYKNEVA